MNSTVTLKKATFGAGCFWCAEAAFKLLKDREGKTDTKEYVAGYEPR